MHRTDGQPVGRWVECGGAVDSVTYLHMHNVFLLLQSKLSEMSAHSLACQYRKVSCSNQGCQMKFKANELQGHEVECQFRVVTCPRSSCNQRVSPSWLSKVTLLCHATKAIKI